MGKGNHASIIGGYTLAGKVVDIYSSGNEYGVNTVIEVGYDYEMKDLLIKNRKKLNDIKKEVKKMDKEIIEYSHMKRLSENMYSKLKEVAEKRKELIDEVQKISDENKEIIRAVRKPSDAYVKISNKIYSGTRIIINRKNFLVREDMFGKTFKLSENNEIIAI